MDNLGVMGLLDAYYHTTPHFDASWQATLNKSYGAYADYPVDKIFAKASAPPGPASEAAGAVESGRRPAADGTEDLAVRALCEPVH
jgi:hypothetical protein